MQRIMFEEFRYQTLNFWTQTEKEGPKSSNEGEENGTVHKNNGRREWHRTDTDTLPKGRGQHFVEEFCHWTCEQRKVTQPNERPNGRQLRPKSAHPTQRPTQPKAKNIRNVPIEFGGPRHWLLSINGSEINEFEGATAADGFAGEISDGPCGGFRIRVKAVDFQPNDFNLSIDSDCVLGVDATHEQQTRDGLVVQRRITRRYQMRKAFDSLAFPPPFAVPFPSVPSPLSLFIFQLASEVDLSTLRAFLTADGQFLEITGEKGQNGTQRQQNRRTEEPLTENRQNEWHFDRRMVPNSATRPTEFGSAERETNGSPKGGQEGKLRYVRKAFPTL